jgi:hypothetical protein
MVLALELAISLAAMEGGLTIGDGDSILLSGSGDYILLLDLIQRQLPPNAEVDTPLLVHRVAMVLALELAISSTAMEDILISGDGDSILLLHDIQRELPPNAEVNTPLLIHRVVMVLALELAISSAAVEDVLTSGYGDSIHLLRGIERELPPYAEVDTPLLVHRVAMVLTLELAISSAAMEFGLTNGVGGSILFLDSIKHQLPPYAEVDAPLLVHWVAMVLALELAISSAAAEAVLAYGGNNLLRCITGRRRRGQQQHPGEQEEQPAGSAPNLPPDPHCCTCRQTIEHYKELYERWKRRVEWRMERGEMWWLW